MPSVRSPARTHDHDRHATARRFGERRVAVGPVVGRAAVEHSVDLERAQHLDRAAHVVALAGA